MGSVWAATHTVTNKQVALKFMHVKSPEMTARFVREAQAASAVRHPNVVDIHDVLTLPDGTPLMVMEMLQGEALADKLLREGRLAPLEAAQILMLVVSAVGAAHAAGVVHRDLKPENIFLAQYQTTVIPKVLDFGIAKVTQNNTSPSSASNLTKTGSVLGTPYYMSPEQVFGEKDVDFRADVWALGVIIYQCLSGRRPFDGDNYGQLFKAITSGTFPPLDSVAPWVAPHIAALVGAMLRERHSRLSDLGEVERALATMAPPVSGPSLPMIPAAQASNARLLPSSGGFVAARAQSSGGFNAPMAAMAPITGPGLTPSPMVRPQTVVMGSDQQRLPIESVPTGRIAAAIGALVAIAAAIALVIHFRAPSAPTTESAHIVVPAVDVPAPPAPLPSTPAETAATVTAAAPTTVASASPVHVAPTPSASASSHPGQGKQHGAGTGGLSTDVPF